MWPTKTKLKLELDFELDLDLEHENRLQYRRMELHAHCGRHRDDLEKLISILSMLDGFRSTKSEFHSKSNADETTTGKCTPPGISIAEIAIIRSATRPAIASSNFELTWSHPQSTKHKSAINMNSINEQTQKLTQTLKTIFNTMMSNSSSSLSPTSSSSSSSSSSTINPNVVVDCIAKTTDQSNCKLVDLPSHAPELTRTFDFSSKFDWPESLIQLLQTLTIKQQNELDVSSKQLLCDDTYLSLSISSPDFDDDRDFELMTFQLTDPNGLTTNQLGHEPTLKLALESDNNSITLTDLPSQCAPAAMQPKTAETIQRSPLPVAGGISGGCCNSLNTPKSTLELSESHYLTRRKSLPANISFNRITSIDLNDQQQQQQQQQQPPPGQPQLESILHVQDFDEDEDSLTRHNEPESLTCMEKKEESCSVSTSSRQMVGDETSAKVSNKSSSSSQQEDGKYSLLQFALYNFREALDKYSLDSSTGGFSTPDTGTLRGSLKLIESLRRSKSGASERLASRKGSRNKSSGASHNQGTGKAGPDWTWRELAQMVKFSPKPLKCSLLKLPGLDLNKRAVECFASIMQYMGDLPGNHASAKLNEVECVYMILMNCHNFPILRDEIYCQLMKQTTNNRSEQPDSCLRGWRLFSIIGAYFDCTDLLKPYLLKYLETAAYDKRRAYCSVALICLHNLRKTFKFGGRKNVPSVEEIAATSAGRNSKRQIYRLPGGTERVINTKSSTVVHDIIHEICSTMLGVSEPEEMLEFSLYCIADGDLHTMPLNRDEYILDITTELIKNHQQYFLIFCRSIWHYPLRLDSKLYIEVIFNQIAPDYLEGLLLVLPNVNEPHQQHRRLSSSASTSSFMSKTNNRDSNTQLNEPHSNNISQPDRQQQQQQAGSKYQLRLRAKLVKDLARIAALLHRASGTDYMPHRDEVKYLLPKPIIAAMKQSHLANSRLQAHSTSSSSLIAHLQSPDTAEAGHSTGPANCQPLADNPDNETILMTPHKLVELVQDNWREMSAFDRLDAKAQFLQIVKSWPLFGSSFFAIKLIQRDLIQPMEFILALNKFGIQMLDFFTHETIHRYPFNEVISTRKVRSEDGALFLDLKCGNLMKRTIIRIQTDQAHEISRLIRQYIDIELIQQKHLQQQTSQQTSTPSLAPGSESNSTIYQDNPTNNQL